MIDEIEEKTLESLNNQKVNFCKLRMKTSISKHGDNLYRVKFTNDTLVIHLSMQKEKVALITKALCGQCAMNKLYKNEEPSEEASQEHCFHIDLTGGYLEVIASSYFSYNWDGVESCTLSFLTTQGGLSITVNDSQMRDMYDSLMVIFANSDKKSLV